MFFKLNRDIGWAVSMDGLFWQYGGVALRASHHDDLSFPFPFAWQDRMYLLPSSAQADGKLQLYEATSFPAQWTVAHEYSLAREIGDRHVVLLPATSNSTYVYLFSSAPDADVMHLHYMVASEFPLGRWQQHALSPLSMEAALGVPSGVSLAPMEAAYKSMWSPRTSGRIAVSHGRLFRFAPNRSGSVYAWEITTLQPTSYCERVWSGVPGSSTTMPVFSTPSASVDTPESMMSGAWRQGGIDGYDAHPRTGIDGQWLVFATGLSKAGQS